MLDQNTDRMWFVIGAVIVGAVIIFIANGTLPELFASVADSFEDVSDRGLSVIDDIVVLDPWAAEDFIYDGGSVLGFSESGLAKVASHKRLVVPSHNPYSNQPIHDVGESAFRDSGLIAVSFPDTISVIDTFAFRGNRLTSVRLPNSIKRLERSSFYGNVIEEIYLPDGLEVVGYNALEHNRLTQVSLPDSLVKIDRHGFANNLIENVHIPNAQTTYYGQSHGEYSFDPNVTVTGGKEI